MTGQQDRPEVALEQYHAYLECLAWMRIDPRLRGKFGLSDVIQNTLLEAYQQLRQLQALNPAMQKVWLRKAVMSNLLDEIDRWRSRGRDVALEQPIREAAHQSSSRLKEWLVSEESTPSARLERHERDERLAEALTRLPTRQREAIVLRYWHKMKLTEIAAHLNCTIGTVAGLIHRGVEKLGIDLKDLG